MNRCHVDNSSPTLFTHFWQARFNGEKGSSEVYVHNTSPFILGKLFDRGNMLNACIIDKNIDWTAFGDLNHFCNLCRLPQISWRKPGSGSVVRLQITNDGVRNSWRIEPV